MTPTAVLLEKETMVEPRRVVQPAVRPAFRLRPIMRQGTASSISEVWRRFSTLEEARAAVKAMYHDDRVLRVFVVTDEMPPRFVEWIER